MGGNSQGLGPAQHTQAATWKPFYFVELLLGWSYRTSPAASWE